MCVSASEVLKFPETQKVSPRATDLSGQTSARFEEFWERYPRKQRKDFAAMQWNSLVVAEVEGLVFACLDRYLTSDEVGRGVVQNPDKWLYEQHRNGWAGDWPKARDSPERTLSVTERAKAMWLKQQQEKQHAPGN